MYKFSDFKIQFAVAATFGAIIACSPTKFNPYDSNNQNALIRTSSNCPEVSPGQFKCTDSFKVGAGKVDILFIDDNSASMSDTQKKLAAKFGGFIENLDAKEIDYQISITTTDLAAVQKKSLITFSNGSTILTKNDSNRVGLFNAAIARPETVGCENFIKSSFYTYGSSFNTTDYYAQNYYANCASNDERGLYTANLAVSGNASGFIRSDANLNLILISNEDVRSGSYMTDSKFALDENDKATAFTSMMSQKYPGKYWEFHSIITKDNSCANSQQISFVDNSNNPIRDSNGNYAIGANLGSEYAALSASPSMDVDGNPSPRGQILSICNNDYSSYFNNIAARISQAARLMSLKCVPVSAPVVVRTNNVAQSVPYQWLGDKILFQPGSEGIPVSVSYQCQIQNAH